MEDLRKLLEYVQNIDSAAGDNEIAFLNSILAAVVKAGFSSARFYEIVKDPIAEADVLVLRAYKYQNTKVKPPVGLRIALHESTLGSSGLNRDIVLGDAETSPPAAREWIRQLHLEKDKWADVPIRDHEGKLYGLLAFTPQTEYDLSDEDQFYLKLVRNAVSQFESNYRLRQLSSLRASITKLFHQYEHAQIPPTQIAELAAKVILPAVGGQACAVFRYEWPTRHLYKSAEYVDGINTDRAILEPYYSGQYLTGAAWEHEQFKHIPDFEKFRASHPNLVFRDSLEFHRATLGGIKSVMYEPFGRRHLRFFVRVINRKENPSLPLNYRHRDMLTNVCEQLTEFTDEVANRTVIRDFEQIATSGIRQITDYGRTLEICVEALESIGFGECAIIYQGKQSPQLEIIHCGDKRLQQSLRTKVFVTNECPFLERAVDGTGTRIVRISDHRTASTDEFLNALRAAGVVATIAVCSAGDSGSIAAIRCAYETQSKLSSSTKLFNNSSDGEVIIAMLSMLAGVIEGSRANVSADFAETLVAQFGHEVATPIAKLQSKSIAGINRAIKVLRDTEIGAEQIPLLNEAKDSIDSQAHRISHHMNAAIALAETSSGSVDVHYEIFSWNRIVDEAWEEALEWRTGMESRAAFRPAVLIKNDAIRSLKSVGDRDLIHGILSNLFKNAIKYSMPRHDNYRPMEVKVIGQPQSSIDVIQVENWGIGIPEDQREAIFRKFKRVERTDRVRAIRGMGLGLYVSRLYAHAHRGQLFCRYSQPTLDDPVRTKDLEGYQTAFELRIPKEQLQARRRVKIKEV
jgi:signal transduction histidine kinase